MLNEGLLVDLPQRDIVRKKQNNNTYIYYSASKFYNKKKQYYEYERINIGKLSEGDPTKMHPNSNYFKYFAQKSVEVIEVPAPYSDTLEIGVTTVLNKLVEEFNLDEILSKTFGSKSTLVKSLVFYNIRTGSNVAQHYESFARKSYPLTNPIYSQSTISNLYNDHITYKEINEFSDLWVNNVHLLSKDKKDVILSIDSTNMNTHSENIRISEYGKPKQDEGLEQVNLSYAILENSGLPVFFDLYPGSIIDQTQFEMLIKKTNTYEFKNPTLVLDRGFHSNKNIELMLDNNYSFIMMARGYYKKIGDLIDLSRAAIFNANNYIIEYGVSCVKQKLILGDNRPVNAYIYYNKRKDYEENSYWDKMVIKFMQDLSKVSKASDGILNTYKSYLKFDISDNGSFKTSPNLETKQEKMNNAGFFVILSNLDLPGNEILRLYRKRDIIEKTFRMLKSELDASKTYAQNDEAYHSKVLVSFISAILRSIFAHKIKKYTLDYSMETVNSSINELAKIEATKNHNIYARKYALTKKQKEILNLLEIDEKDIDKDIQKINLFLS